MRRLLLISALALAAFGCGPKTLEQRQNHGEKLADEATGQLDEAEKLMRQLEPKKAEEALRAAKETIDEPDLTLSPESDLLKSRLQELRTQLPSVREQRRLRDLDDAVRDRRSKIGPVLQAVRDGVDSLSGKGLDEKKVEATEDATKDLSELLEDTRELELRDEDFKSYVKRARSELDTAKSALKVAKQKLEFVEGPIAQRDEATELHKSAKSEKDKQKKLQLLTDAAAGYRKCAASAAKYETLDVIYVKGNSTSANAVEASCKSSETAALADAKKLEKTSAKSSKKKKRR